MNWSFDFDSLTDVFKTDGEVSLKFRGSLSDFALRKRMWAYG